MANLNIFVNVGDTPLAAPAYEKLKPLLNSDGIAEVARWQDADLRLALGGDGTALHEARKDIPRAIQNRRPILGLKAGNPLSKGMLLNEVDFDDLDTIEALMRENIEHRMPYLKVEAKDISGRDKKAYVFNDTNTLRVGSQSAVMRVLLDGKEQNARALGDGFLVSTAQGSTAYNLAAGGTVSSDPQSLILTGIASRNLKSIMLPPDRVVEMEVLEPEKRPQKLELDGRLAVRRLRRVKIEIAFSVFSTLAFKPELTFADKLVQEAMSH